MSAKWGQGWRKLYCNPSPAWLMLSYSARGLGYEILRVCDDDGRINCGGADPFEVIARLCVIGGHKRRAAKEDFEALKADGFVVVEGGFLCVRNFRAAQETLSPAAAKKAAQRAKAPPPESPKPTELGPNSDRTLRNFAELGLNFAEPCTNFAELPGNPAKPQESNGDSPHIIDLEENKKRLEEKKTHCPSPSAVGTASVPEGQPTEKVDPPKLELSAPPPAKPKAAKRSEDPPPFSWRSGLEVIATACSRFALPGDREVTKEQAIALAKQVRTFPKLEDWKLAGEFLGANGEGWRLSLNVSYVASSSFAATIAAARAWEKRGRPAMDRKGNEQDPTKGPATGWSHRRMTDAEFDSLVEVVPVGGGHGRPATTR